MAFRSGQSVAWFPAVTVPDTPYYATGANLGVSETRSCASSQAQRPTSLIDVFRNLLLPASIQEIDFPENPSALFPDSATDSAAEGGERRQASIHSFRSAPRTKQIDANAKQNADQGSVTLFASNASALSRQPAWPFSMPDSQFSITGVNVDSDAGNDVPPKRLRSEGSTGVAQSTRYAADGPAPTLSESAGPAELKARVTTGQAGFVPDNRQERLSIAAIAELTPKPVERSAEGLRHGGEQSIPVLQESQTIAPLSTQAGAIDVVAQATSWGGERGGTPAPNSQGFARGRAVSANSFDGNRDQTTEKTDNSPKPDVPPQLAESVGTAKHLNSPEWSDRPATGSTPSRQIVGVALDPFVQNQSRGSASSSLAIAISPQPDSTAVAGHERTLDWCRTSTSCPAEPVLGKDSATGQFASSQRPSFVASPSSSRVEPTSPQPGSTGSVMQKESLAWSGSPMPRPAESAPGRETALSQFAPGQRPSSAVSLSAPRNGPVSPQPDSNGFVTHQNSSGWSGNYARDSAESERESITAQIRSAQVQVNGAPDRLKAPLVVPASLQTDSGAVANPTDSLQFRGNSDKSDGDTRHEGETGLGRYDRRENVPKPTLTNKPAGGDLIRLDQSGGIANTETAQMTVTAPALTRQNEVQETSRPLTQEASADGAQESTLPAQPSRTSAPISSIEVQVQLQSDSQIGLRFIDRNGHIEVQMKSADQQAAQTLIGGLDGLKSSLAREGWSVESRIPARPTLAAETTPEASAFGKVSAPTSQPAATSLPRLAWVDALSPVEEGHVRGFQEHTDNAQYVRPEPPAPTPLNHRGDSDSSTGQDRSHPDQGGTSERKEEQHSTDHSSRDSEKQGRRPTHNTETWMDSIESLLSQPTPARSSTGA